VRSLALDIPNLLPDWHFLRPAGRLIWSTVIVLVMTGGVVSYARKPKSAEPTTWAMAMLGAVYVFLLMIIAYGTVPHEWLNFANSYLKWDASHYVIRKDQWFFKTDISKAAVTDIIASGIYVVFLGANVYLFSMWQKRPTQADLDKATASTEAKPAGTSAYGRPLTSKA
jgi:hypothetical protein